MYINLNEICRKYKMYDVFIDVTYIVLTKYSGANLHQFSK